VRVVAVQDMASSGTFAPSRSSAWTSCERQALGSHAFSVELSAVIVPSGFRSSVRCGVSGSTTSYPFSLLGKVA